MRSAALLTVTAVALIASAQAQVQFKTSTELVSVYATVQDPGGRLVTDLRQEDFTITDEGRAQRITFFSNEIAPLSVVILLDRSGSMLQHLNVIRDAASTFVDQMLPGDRARIGVIGTRVTIAPPEFTSDHQALRDVLAVPLEGGASPVWMSIDQSLTALYGQSGRRVVLIFSDGEDDPALGQPSTSFKDLFERVKRSEVMVYAVGFAAREMRNGKLKIHEPDERLRELADVSGGGYFELGDTADLGRVFTRVAEELHRQYWLGFEPQKRDGKFHDLRVRVKRPGVSVRARPSYLAPAPR